MVHLTIRKLYMEGGIVGPLKAEAASHSPLPPSVCMHASEASVMSSPVTPQVTGDGFMKETAVTS